MRAITKVAALGVALSACAPGERIEGGQRQVAGVFAGQAVLITWSPDNSRPARMTAAPGGRMPTILEGGETYSSFMANTIDCPLNAPGGARVQYDDLQLIAVVAETAC